jgi:hypothetical protein
MAWGKGPAGPSPVTPLPTAERGEHWWPVALAIIAVVGMHVALPARYRVDLPWVVPIVLLGLLAAGGMIWATNVIAFGLWYWDLDRGGPAARAHHPQADQAFVFAEMQHTDYTPAGWVPKFADYLSLSFGPRPRSAPPTCRRSSGGPS